MAYETGAGLLPLRPGRVEGKVVLVLTGGSPIALGDIEELVVRRRSVDGGIAERSKKAMGLR